MCGDFDEISVEASAAQLREARRRITRSAQGETAIERGWYPAQREMADAVQDPPTTIAGVLARLDTVQQIMDGLPPGGGANRVAAFNSLYRQITQQVADLLPTSQVLDATWLEALDVEFARLYFQALELWNDDNPETPDAWEVLFGRAQDEDLDRMTAAALGVNAHINHDLALALTATWQRLGFPGDGRQHHDYLLINKIFFKQIPVLRRRFATAWQLEIDQLVGDLDDWSQGVLVQTTRAMAWEQAELLWALRGDPEDLARARSVVDRAAAIAGETLLTGDNAVRVLWLTVRGVTAALWTAVVRRVRSRRIVTSRAAAPDTSISR
jgi:hypothetical protein